MGPVNVVKRLSLSEEAISRLIDPRTGERLRPLGVVGGRVVWPIMGGAPKEDDDDEENEGDNNENKDESDDPEGDDESEDEPKGDPKAKIAALEDEKNRHVRRRQEAETERDELRQKLKSIEDRDKSDADRNSERLTELTSENENLRVNLKKSRIENAFLMDNKYNWHNPGRALQVVDLSDVEIDSDGNVLGMRKALDALAKSDPYLLKQESNSEDAEPKPNTQNGQRTPSRKDKSRGAGRDEELRKKYPALRR